MKFISYDKCQAILDKYINEHCNNTYYNLDNNDVIDLLYQIKADILEMDNVNVKLSE